MVLCRECLETLNDQIILLGVGSGCYCKCFLFSVCVGGGGVCFLCVFSIQKAVVLLAIVFLNNNNKIYIFYKRITPEGPHIMTKLYLRT